MKLGGDFSFERPAIPHKRSLAVRFAELATTAVTVFDAAPSRYGEIKIPTLAPLLCVGIFVASHSAFGMESVTSCALGANGGHTLSLLRDNPIGGTAVYYLRKDGAAPVRIYPGEPDQSRGENIQIACVGAKERVFVISGEFASNYLQGVAVRFNAKRRRWQRVEFAERERPTAVYTGSNGLAVLIPNSGKNESPKRYIIYQYDARTGKTVQSYSDRLPKSGGTPIPVE
jgi:hypothetical protein